MTGRELVRWSALHERRARRGGWTSRWVLALVGGAGLAAVVAWRGAAAGPIAASHAWLAVALVAFALAFLRVPFHIYWRSDAALLAQLPIEGGPLLDAALVRCARAAAATTLAIVIGALPLARFATELVWRHAAFAGALGVAAAGALPAVATAAAMLVAAERQATGARALHIATALAGASPAAAARAATGTPVSSGTVLGALPGFAASAVIVAAVLVVPWLVGEPPALPAAIVLGGLAAVSLVALAATRALAAPAMAIVLRDVSALDRQRLAPLDIRAPTAIERAVAGMLGAAALPYRKDARLVRRRYPMAFALGAVVTIGVVAIAAARPRDPTWLVVTVGAAALYGIVLAGRLARPPIELPRLAATLPIADAARARARRAWLAAWWGVFVLVPGVVAVVRAVDVGAAAGALGAATAVIAVAAARSR